MIGLCYDVNKCITLNDFINNDYFNFDGYIGIDEKINLFVIYNKVIGLKYGYYENIEYLDNNVTIHIDVDANDFYFGNNNNNINDLIAVVRKFKINKLKRNLKK